MSVASRQNRRPRGMLLTLGLWLLAASPLLASDRAETPRAEAPGAPVAVPTAPPLAWPGTPEATTLDASRPLPGGSVPWTTLAAPPAFGGGGLLLQGGGPAPQLRYYAVDALGSVRVVFDATGAVVSRADYEPFGAAVPASTTGTLPRQQYTGHERDGEVGVDYFGARMYTPTLGRMPSVDPLYAGAMAQPQRWNRYAYALNNPTGTIDPDGRNPCPSPMSEEGPDFTIHTECPMPPPRPTIGTRPTVGILPTGPLSPLGPSPDPDPPLDPDPTGETVDPGTTDCEKTVQKIVTDVEHAVTTKGMATLTARYVNPDAWGYPRGRDRDYFGASSKGTGFMSHLVAQQWNDIYRHLAVNMGAAMRDDWVGAAMHRYTRAEAVAQFYTSTRRIEAVSEWHDNVAGYSIGQLALAYSRTEISKSTFTSFVEQTLCK